MNSQKNLKKTSINNPPTSILGVEPLKFYKVKLNIQIVLLEMLSREIDADYHKKNDQR
jgi:hypothetical protein